MWLERSVLRASLELKPCLSARPGHVHRMCLSFIGRPVMNNSKTKCVSFLALVSILLNLTCVFLTWHICFFLIACHICLDKVNFDSEHDSGFRRAGVQGGAISLIRSKSSKSFPERKNGPSLFSNVPNSSLNWLRGITQ